MIIMKVWISENALTQGIFEVEGMQRSDVGRADIFEETKHKMRIFYGEDIAWHKTKEEAIERAEVMRMAEIKRLEKQIKKLQELKFE